MNGEPSRSTGAWRVSTPGRVCLFGEHQDYLGLPVISAAISLRLSIEGRQRADLRVRVAAPDIAKEYEFDLLPRRAGDGGPGWRNFLLNGVEVLRETGCTFSRGFDCTIRGDIPIRGGTSSSSAMVVSWINLLARMSDQRREIPSAECALLAHRAEVDLAGGVGGRMDQYATAVGGLLFQSFHPKTLLEPLPAGLGAFVLGDSEAKKDTQGILSRVKERVHALVASVRARHPGFSLHSARWGEVDDFLAGLPDADRGFLRATLRNREITLEGRELLRQASPDPRALGGLLDEQHSILRGNLGISTPKIDAMLDAARRAGAAGGKINGSGGGGCMFAYVPDDPERAAAVAAAVAGCGGRSFVVSVDEGTRTETVEGGR